MRTAAALLLLLAPRQDSPEACVEEARRCYEKGRNGAALKALDRALELDPTFMPARMWRGQIRMEEQDHAGALGDVDILLRSRPKDGRLWGIRGILRMRLDDPAAEEDFTRALELDPKDGKAYALRGIWRVSHKKDPRAALPDLERALELGPVDFEIQGFRGLAFAFLAEPRKALVDLTRSLERKPDVPFFLQTRAWSYAALGAWDAARQDVERVRALQPAGDGEADLLLWLCRAHQGGRAEADEALAGTRGRPGIHPENAALVPELVGGPLPAEKPTEAAWAARKAFWSAMKRRLDGDETGALALLAEAARFKGPMLAEASAARTLEADLRTAARRARLEPLEKKWMGLKTLYAEFEAKRPPAKEGGDPEDRVPLAVALDLEGRRLYFRARMPMGLVQSYCGPDNVWHGWGDDLESAGWNADPFFRLVQDYRLQGLRAIDAIRGRPPTAAAPPLQPLCGLTFEARQGDENEGTLRFALGWAENGKSSWASEIIASPDAELSEADGDLVARIPSRRRTLRVEQATGVLRSIEAVDPDGRLRTLTRTAFQANAPFAGVAPPKPGRPGVPPLDEMKKVMAGVDALLPEQLAETVQAWDDIVKAGREKEVEALLVDTAARQTAAVFEVFLRIGIRQGLQSYRSQGVPLQAIVEKRDEVIASLQRSFLEHPGWPAARRKVHDDLIEKAFGAAVEKPVLPQRHPLLRRLSKEVLDLPRVDEALQRIAPALFKRIAGEEIDALRQL